MERRRGRRRIVGEDWEKIAVELPPDLVRELEDRARSAMRSRSQFLREMLQRELRSGAMAL